MCFYSLNLTTFTINFYFTFTITVYFILTFHFQLMQTIEKDSANRVEFRNWTKKFKL